MRENTRVVESTFVALNNFLNGIKKFYCENERVVKL